MSTRAHGGRVADRRTLVGWAVRWIVAAGMVALAIGVRLDAQEPQRLTQLAAGAPRFWTAPASDPSARRDARDAAVFRQQVVLDLHAVPLRAALTEIARQAGLRISVSGAIVALETPVTLSAPKLSVGAALTAVLFDAGVDIQLSGDGKTIAIVPRLDAAPAQSERPVGGQPGGGTITGAIVDTVTKQSVPYVTVSLDDGAQTVRASAQGQYVIGGVAVGEHRVTAKRVGFIPKMRTVTVEDGKVATLNFAINRPPTHLDEVVTTALGDQRRYQVGNVIATVNVDSIAPTVPAMSLTDLLSARVPGLSILETGGLTGSGEAIRIRGESSLLLQGDPIIYVDGIRSDNTAGGVVGPTFFGDAGPSRINDLDFSQIETIDILKGPAASTEYGTDAANGVIVITTKRGAVGKPRWTASAEQEFSAIPDTFPEFYYSWGHTKGSGAASAVNCPLVSSTGFSATSGTCAVDSVTHFDPLNHPAYSLFGTGLRNKYDLSVSGGSDAIRYYLAGGLSNETGIERLPDVFRREASALGFPSSVENPNSQGQRSGRLNTTLRLNSTADVSVNVAYLSTHAALPTADLSGPASAGTTLSDSAHNFGYGRLGSSDPLYQVSQTYAQQTDQVTAGLTLSWRPNAWLATHATFGIDHESQETQSLVLPQAHLLFADSSGGQLAQGEFGKDIYSADVRASAVAPITRWMRAVTSVGLQLADQRDQGLQATANQGINSASLTLNGLSNVTVNQASDRSATLGGYVEEQLGFAERLFLTGALRIDGGSGFGSAVRVAPYPKVSASWLALTSGPTTVRFRAAVGAAGRQPLNGAALELAQATTAYANGGYLNGYTVTNPGDPQLKPERSVEYEGGVDLGFWGNRVSLEFSGYQKTTFDALYDLQLGWDLNNEIYEENIGKVRNGGLEGTLTAVIIESRPFLWSVSVNGSVNHNSLVNLAPGAQTVRIGAQQQRPGYPLYGFWGGQEHYADVNHDGIIESNEVTVDTGASYMGSSVPTQTASFATHVGVWHGAVTLGALFDYHGGYRVYNSYAQVAAANYSLPEQNVAGTALWLQARAVAWGSNPNNVPSGFFEDGTMVRFREVSLSYNLPTTMARALRVGSIGLTGAVRNLALWTRYTGVDPEVGGGAIVPNYVNGTRTQNNDVREGSAFAVPEPRFWVLRVNVGL